MQGDLRNVWWCCVLWVSAIIFRILVMEMKDIIGTSMSTRKTHIGIRCVAFLLLSHFIALVLLFVINLDEDACF